MTTMCLLQLLTCWLINFDGIVLVGKVLIGCQMRRWNSCSGIFLLIRHRINPSNRLLLLGLILSRSFICRTISLAFVGQVLVGNVFQRLESLLVLDGRNLDGTGQGQRPCDWITFDCIVLLGKVLIGCQMERWNSCSGIFLLIRHMPSSRLWD